MFTGAGRFDRGVEREQVRLIRDVFDRVDDLLDLRRAAVVETALSCAIVLAVSLTAELPALASDDASRAALVSVAPCDESAPMPLSSFCSATVVWAIDSA